MWRKWAGERQEVLAVYQLEDVQQPEGVEGGKRRKGRIER